MVILQIALYAGDAAYHEQKIKNPGGHPGRAINAGVMMKACFMYTKPDKPVCKWTDNNSTYNTLNWYTWRCSSDYP
jgi:hypothetical protein